MSLPHIRRRRARLLLGLVAVIAAAVAGGLAYALSTDSAGSTDASAEAPPAGRTPPTGRSAPRSQASPPRQGSGDVASLWRGYAACLREHGSPSLPDPRILPNGSAEWDDVIAFRQALARLKDGDCDAELGALPPQALNPPVLPEELQQLVQLSQCMREHGVTDWPDPNPDGRFPFDDRLRALDKIALSNLIEPCKQFFNGHVEAVPIDAKALG